MTNEEPRIYVADLADYNNGILRGVWIDLAQKDKDDILEEINAMLSEKPGHEEWAVHDQEYLPGINSEWPDLDMVVAVVTAIDHHGYEPVKAYLSVFDVADIDQFEDRYRGEWDSLTDYAEDYISQCYDIDKMLGNLASYFDYEAFGRDLELGGDICFVDGYVFDNH